MFLSTCRNEKKDLQRRIIELELQLYKQYDTIQVHKKKFSEKNKKISSLLKQSKYLNKQKLEREREDETARQRTGLSVSFSIFILPI